MTGDTETLFTDDECTPLPPTVVEYGVPDVLYMNSRASLPQIAISLPSAPDEHFMPSNIPTLYSPLVARLVTYR
jgi:hypothetical protein